MVLLLLVVVAQLPLALGCHAAFCLRNLIRIVGSRGISLALVVALDVGRRMGSHPIVLAHGVVALRSAAHARI